MLRNNIKIIHGADTVGADVVLPKFEVAQEVLKDFPQNLQLASKLHDEMEKISCSGKSPGDKYSGTEAQRNLLMPLYDEYKKAIAPSRLETLYVGTTVANKEHYLKAVAGDTIKTVLFSAVSNDTVGQKIAHQLEKNGVILDNHSESLESTRVNFVMTPKGFDNRIINKFPYQAPSFFYDFDKQVKNATSCDIYLLEASQIQFFKSPTKFREFIHIVKDSGTKIVFAPPTDKKFFLENGELKKDNINAFFKASKFASLITMNETEAIWSAGNPNYKASISGKDDADLNKALRHYKHKLRRSNATIVITAGEHGLFIMNNGAEIYKKISPVETIINTAGAGDSAAAMAIYGLLVKNKTITPDVMNNAADLITKAGAIKVQSLDVQVPHNIFRFGLNGIVASYGNVDLIEPPTFVRGMAKH